MYWAFLPAVALGDVAADEDTDRNGICTVETRGMNNWGIVHREWIQTDCCVSVVWWVFSVGLGSRKLIANVNALEDALRRIRSCVLLVNC